jgi:hypothetical protein
MTMAVGAFAVSFNVFATKHLPVFDVVILVMFVIGFFVVIIPLWVLAPRASVGDVFGKFENFGGWSTMGGACIVGQMAASAAFIVSCSEDSVNLGCFADMWFGRASTARYTWPRKSRMHLALFHAWVCIDVGSSRSITADNPLVRSPLSPTNQNTTTL